MVIGPISARRDQDIKRTLRSKELRDFLSYDSRPALRSLPRHAFVQSRPRPDRFLSAEESIAETPGEADVRRYNLQVDWLDISEPPLK